MGHSHSQPSAALHLPPSLTHTGLPPRIAAAYEKSWTKITILLSDATTPNAPTGYAITLDQGWYGSMTMRAGPRTEDPALAEVQPAGRMRQDFAVGLPALGPDAPQRAEVLRYVVGWKREMYWFAMEVGNGNGARQVERFEWRRSRGGEVKGVEGGSGWGWKLVRMGAGEAGAAAAEGHGHAEEGVDGLTSDGKEVVAVWANPGTLSLTKLGQFEFRGSGATGELGLLWSIMAVMSCMCIWQKTMQSAITTGVVAGAA
ncbi:uncharacterized protein B0H64DRAFT_51091 [Chaetomium fimeti]|uniref:Uncharacterized protein n=1 Tax=Chaetomium fimeti TaxID=1854472 RepID=A0AAE0LMN9_9PEZI|nr:hypothetical protein B0H64DRAFT_51091 [Chaetomium fimeti]